MLVTKGRLAALIFLVTGSALAEPPPRIPRIGEDDKPEVLPPPKVEEKKPEAKKPEPKREGVPPRIPLIQDDAKPTIDPRVVQIVDPEVLKKIDPRLLPKKEIAPPPRVLEPAAGPKADPPKPVFQPPPYDPRRAFEPVLPKVESKKETKDNLEKLTGKTAPIEQFFQLGDLLSSEDGAEARRTAERAAKLEPKLNKALLSGRNWELLGSPLFSSAVNTIAGSRGKDGRFNLVVYFEDGSTITILSLALTDDEIDTLLKGSKRDERFDRVAGGPYATLAKPSDALALLNEFRLERTRRVLGPRRSPGEGEQTYAYDFLARERRDRSAPSSKPMADKPAHK